MDETRKIPRLDNFDNEAKNIINTVYQALVEKGYNDIDLAGYILG